MKTETRPSLAERSDEFPLHRRPPAEIAVVIPAWQPAQPLLALVSELRPAGVRQLVLIDDGSDAGSRPIFDALGSLAGVQEMRHSVTLGKRSAQKWAFQHVLSSMPTIHGVVTADADGQHLPKDIVAVSRRLAANPDRAVLGTRDFHAGIPWRSRVGNLFTRKIFALLTGHAVRDTQTGLRGLPVSLLPELLQLPGERYEYETVMLAHLCQTGQVPLEEPIETVYLQGNRASHLRPVRDGLRVYRALFRAGRRGRSARVPKPAPYGKAEEPRLHVA